MTMMMMMMMMMTTARRVRMSNVSPRIKIHDRNGFLPRELHQALRALKTSTTRTETRN